MTINANSLENNTKSADLIMLIAQWHCDRNLIDGSTDKDQYLKLIQEAGELSDNICKGNDIADDIGDMLVVLINIAERNGLSLQHCLEVAYDDIKHRKGKMVDGIFVKEADGLAIEDKQDLTSEQLEDIYWSVRSRTPIRELSKKYQIPARRVYELFDQELLKKVKTAKIQDEDSIYFPRLSIRATNGLVGYGIKTYCRLMDLYSAEGPSCLVGIPNIGKITRHEVSELAEALIKEVACGR